MVRAWYINSHCIYRWHHYWFRGPRFFLIFETRHVARSNAISLPVFIFKWYFAAFKKKWEGAIWNHYGGTKLHQWRRPIVAMIKEISFHQGFGVNLNKWCRFAVALVVVKNKLFVLHCYCCYNKVYSLSLSLSLSGIGYAMILLTGIVSTYYNVILAWTLYYFGMSFSSELPWTRCDKEWNTDTCIIRGMNYTPALFINNYTEKKNVSLEAVTLLHTSAEEFWE